MYELYIQDTGGTFCLADLGTDLPAINIQRNDLGELKDRQTDYSQALKLPKTPTNVKIFSFVDEFSVSAPKVYSVDADYSTLPDIRNAYIACRLYIDGCTIVGTGGYLKITQITDSIEVQIVGGIAGFFTQLQETDSTSGEQKTLNDLTFSGGIIRGLAGFQASTSPKDVDCFFGIADFAEELFTYNYSHYLNFQQQQAQYPFVKYSTIINRILTENGGFSLVTNIADNIKYKNACIPFNSINQTPTTVELNMPLQSYLISYDVKYDIMQVGQFTATTAGTFYFRLLLAMTERHASTSHKYCFLYKINNGEYIHVRNPSFSGTTYTNGATALFDSLSADTDNSIELNLPLVATDWDTGNTLSTSITMAAGDTLKVYFELEIIAGLEVELICTGTGIVLPLLYGETTIGQTIPITKNLPSCTQSDFFKDFLLMYGLTVDIDNDTKTIYAYTLNKVVENKANAKDWSQKYNIGSGEKQNTLGSYVQTNYIKYADQSNDLGTETFTQISEDVARYYYNNGKSVWYDNFIQDSDGNAISGVKYQMTTSGGFIPSQSEYYALTIMYTSLDMPVVDRGTLSVSNTTLDSVPADTITFKSEATKNIVRQPTEYDSATYNYAKIKRLSAGVFPDDPTMRLLMFYQNDDSPDADRARDTISIRDDDGTTPPLCTELGQVRLYAIASEILEYTKDGVTYPAISLRAESLVNEFYGAFQSNVLDDVRFIQDAEFYLTPQDIQEYDPFTPVYIDTFGAYFYVNKIKNFVSGKLTKVDLVRI